MEIQNENLLRLLLHVHLPLPVRCDHRHRMSALHQVQWCLRTLNANNFNLGRSMALDRSRYTSHPLGHDHRHLVCLLVLHKGASHGSQEARNDVSS